MVDGVRITVDPEQINRMLSESILQSAIGEQLQKVIDQEVQKLSHSYNNPIERTVQSEIQTQLHKIIVQDYQEKIKEMVAEKVTEQFTVDLFDRMWDKFVSRY